MLKQLLNITLCIGMIVLIGSCKKKDLPVNQTDTPEFYVTGNIDGKSITINAGDDNYYMYSATDFVDGGVTTYKGELKTEFCTVSCPQSFVLVLRNEKESAEQIVGEPLLRKGPMPYTNINAGNEYLVQFNPEESYTSKAVQVDYEWDFGDGTKSKEKTPTHIFTGEKSSYNVTLHVSTSKGCESIINNRIYISSGSPATADFQITQDKNALYLQPELEEIQAENYLWEFEGGNTASTRDVDYHINPKKGIEKVCLTVTDKSGKKSQRCKNLILEERYAFCAANFTYQSESRSDPNGDLQLGTAHIQYTDENGVVFFSRPATIANDSFEILSVEDYEENNVDGLPTKKVTFRISNTTLTSIEGKTIDVKNVTGSLAVAYLSR